MAKRIIAVFNDFASAENAAYQLEKEHLYVKDISIYQKNMDTGRYDHESRGYARIVPVDGLRPDFPDKPYSNLGFVPAYGTVGGIVEVSQLSTGDVSDELSERYAGEINDGCVIWTIKAADEDTQIICETLYRCGAVRIDCE